jgi:3-methylcrotonyl-CoA carboxylase alpha subunit
MIQQRILRAVRLHRQQSKIYDWIPRSSSYFHSTFSVTPIDDDNNNWKQSLNKISIASKRKISSKATSLHRTGNEIGLRKVLIANRGEIACRVQRTCHKWEIPTVAIYSSADTACSWHAQMASEAYQIGTGPAVSDSYLRMDDIIKIAIQSGCDSIHPGYGFLSENSKFAQKCVNADLVFIGPSPSAIIAMGDKAQSKAIMENAGVPTTPGYYDASTNTDGQDVDFLYSKAIDIGFPLLIKAVAGGGGKGMRIVWNEKDFRSGLESCQNEAYNNFGNSAILLEKYLFKPRHVEMQIIADTHGNAVHLHERDCSVQRRHQKVFEEAPAIDLHAELRTKFGEMAVKAAQAVQYVNAGTVEFLLDTNTSATGTAEQPFYFCEMNTRLQVEHPVSELITGVDLVEWQLRVAAGQELPIINQSDIPCNGHAIEARIYAERQTTDGGFLPATGVLWHHHYDTSSLVTTISEQDKTIVRVDTGLRRTNLKSSTACDSTLSEATLPEIEQQISVYYDPMISKLIVHGPDRTIALKQLIHSLQGYQIAGVPTNIPFLTKCAQHPMFKAGGESITTGFLDDYGADLKVSTSLHMADTVHYELCQVVGTFAVMLHLENRLEPPSILSKKPWSSNWGSWRIGSNNIPQQTIKMKDGMSIKIWKQKDGSYDIEPVKSSSCTKYHLSGWLDTKTKTMEVIINNSERIQMTTVVRFTSDSIDDDTISIRMWPTRASSSTEVSSWELDLLNPMVSFPSLTTDKNDTSSNGVVKSPMPGKVTRINYHVGDTVEQGDIIAVMEAMKMEHPLVAPCNGIIQTLNYKVDDLIKKDGSVVFVVQPAADDDVAV